MEDDAPPKKKRSRFFSGGKSLIGTIQSNLQDRDTSAAKTAPKSEEKSVGITSATATKPNNGSESADDEPQGDSDTEPLELGRVSTAAAALQKLSVNPNAKRRQGIGPDAFKELTSKALLPTAAPPAQKTNSAFSTSSTNFQPRLIASANVPPTRWPPARPAGTDALRSKYQEGQEGPSHRHLQGQPSTLNSSQQPSTPPVFPNLHTQAQDLVLPPREEPSKSAQTRPDAAQPSLPRKYDSTTTDQLASRPIGNIPNTGITNLPLHATLTPTRTPRANGTSLGHLRSTVSPTLYMSPNRLENAVAASRKRKRTGIILPPPAYIYTRTNSPNFNIFPAILLYPEICFHLSTHLPLNSLVALYAISRDFHTILDSRFTTVILSQSLAKAPESSCVFPFRCYAHLCRKDPASRIPHPDPVKARAGISRAVPSFRWLRMVLWREKVVHEIIAIMAEDGVPLPSRCSLALKRMWFILDIPDNARRIGYIHSNTLVPDLDLYFLMCLFVKLDMRFNDPCAQNVYHGLRKIILAHRSLTFLLRVLKRQELRTQYDVLQAWTRFRYVPLPDEVGLSIFGVKANEVGKGRFEYWGKRTAADLRREVQVLLRPEQLVMREAVRRGIRFHRHFLRSLLYGYVRPDTLENYAPRELERRDPRLADEYGTDDEVGGVDIPADVSQRDPLLDLGGTKEVSVLCVKVGNESDQEEFERRKREGEFLERCMQWSQDEREWENMDVGE